MCAQKYAQNVCTKVTHAQNEKQPDICAQKKEASRTKQQNCVHKTTHAQNEK